LRGKQHSAETRPIAKIFSRWEWCYKSFKAITRFNIFPDSDSFCQQFATHLGLKQKTPLSTEIRSTKSLTFNRSKQRGERNRWNHQPLNAPTGNRSHKNSQEEQQSMGPKKQRSGILNCNAQMEALMPQSMKQALYQIPCNYRTVAKSVSIYHSFLKLWIRIHLVSVIQLYIHIHFESSKVGYEIVLLEAAQARVWCLHLRLITE